MALPRKVTGCAGIGGPALEAVGFADAAEDSKVPVRGNADGMDVVDRVDGSVATGGGVAAEVVALFPG